MSKEVKALVRWYEGSGRKLPWRDTGDPYLIWISEIILQQTRVVQGTPYYNRFVSRFPDVESLANASLDEVLKHWEGLGYYARARNLHKAAQIILNTYKGHFPKSLDELQKLPGIGPYTARAIASFAFHLPCAVLDGNVFRILSRYYGDDTCIDLPSARAHYQKRADKMMGGVASADFNQAVMDLGAIICKPQNPDCSLCPLSSGCVSVLTQSQDVLPVRKQKQKRPVKLVHVLVLQHKEGSFWIHQRATEGLWGGLFEFPWHYAEDVSPIPNGLPEGEIIGRVHHVFTHFEMNMQIIRCIVPTGFRYPDGVRIRVSQVRDFAFTKAAHKIFKVLQNKNIVK
jgi:A/G-specific adenine glycosylase